MTDKLSDEKLDTPPIDASTVVLMRDGGEDGLEILMLCRGNSHTVMNNAYVFPGGKLDPADRTAALATDLQLRDNAVALLGEPGLTEELAGALFVAACRETEEETGVQISPPALYPLSRWITPNTPSMMRKRFDARFFVARMPEGQTAIHDGQEATASAWYSPRTGLEAYLADQITLAPPQIMTLVGMLPFSSVSDVQQSIHNQTPPTIEPHVFKDANGGRILCYPGDVDHPVSRRALPGPTRLIWRNEKFVPEQGFEALFP